MNSFQRNIYRTESSVVILPAMFNFTVASGSGTTGYTTACPETTYPQIYYCGDSPIIIGSILYEDNLGATEVVGANLWYKEQSSATAYRIDNTGVVIDAFNC